MNLTALITELRDELLPLVPQARNAIEKARNSGKPADVAPARELLHKVAGTATSVGLPRLSRLAGFGEALAILVLTGEAKASDPTLSLLGGVLDAVDDELSSSVASRPKVSNPQPDAPSVSPSPSSSSPLEPGVAAGDKLQVLLVEGDAISVKLFGKVLVDHGIGVKSVKSSEVAALLEQGVGDLLLFDFSKAPTASASELVTLAKAKAVPVVALSKLKRDDPGVRNFSSEVDEFLVKPVPPEAMVAAVRKLAGRRRRAQVTTLGSPTPTPQPRRLASVLVVDDSSVVRKVVRAFLTASNLDVIEAENGSVALKLLEALQQLPVAAVIDMQMPVLGGLELARALRTQERMREVAIVLLSGEKDPLAEQAAIAAGAGAFLLKQRLTGPELRFALRAAGMTISEP